jgi:hypothetical protein
MENLNTKQTSKTSRYFKYAIGEIVLVVIGILIALQINNWNEQRKILQSEQEILTNLKSELIINRDRLDKILQIHLKEYSDGLKLLHLFNTDISKIPVSKLDSLLSNIEGLYTFEANDGYIKSLIASGKIDHIQNETIKGFLTAFEGQVIDAIQEVKVLERLLNDRLWPAIDGRINSSSRIRLWEGFSDFPKGSYPSDYDWFFSSREMADVVSNITSWTKTVIVDEQELKDNINQQILLITNQLEN